MPRQKLRPPFDLRKFVAWLIVIIPTGLALGFATSGKLLYAFLAFLAMPVLYIVLGLVDLLLNRLSYYWWIVAQTVPLQLAGYGLLVLSSYGLFVFFEEGRRLHLGALNLNAGAHVLFCVGGLIASSAFLLGTYRRLRPFSFQKPIPVHLGTMTAAYSGVSEGGGWVSESAVGRQVSTTNTVFSVAFSVASFVTYIELHFIALERLSSGGKSTGVVWTSTKLGLLSPLAVVYSDGNKERLVNAGNRITRCNVSEGTCLKLYGASPDGENLVTERAKFRVVIYLKHGGIMEDEVVIPEDPLGAN